MFAERVLRTLESEARSALASALAPVPGPKTLLVDDTLFNKRLSVARPLDLFTDTTFLREHGIRTVASLSSYIPPTTSTTTKTTTAKSSSSSSSSSSTTTTSTSSTLEQKQQHSTSGAALVIIIRGINAAAAKSAAAVLLAHLKSSNNPNSSRANTNINSNRSNGTSSSTSSSSPPPCLVLTTPRRSRIVEKVMRVSGLADIVPIAPLPLGFLPFDADLVTLDWPEAFRQVVLDGDQSALLATASAISMLADVLHLRFTTIRSAGAAAAAVVEELLQTHGQTYAMQQQQQQQQQGNNAYGTMEQPSLMSPYLMASSSMSTSSTTAVAIAAAQRTQQQQQQQPASNRSGLFPTEDTYTETEQQIQRDQNQKEQRQQQNQQSNASPTLEPTLADVSSKEPDRHGITLIVLDRRADIVTPLLTQWTYEGLMDEALGLHNNVLDLPVSSMISEDAMNILRTTPDSSGKVRKRMRGDGDRIFSRLRDLNYWSAARQIGSVASSVRAYYDARPTSDSSTEISQVKDYVKGLRQVKSEHASATIHTAIAAEISARTFDSLEFKRRFEVERDMIEGGAGVGRRTYITDAIAKGQSLSHIVRLCCLWSLTSNGIPHDDLDTVKHEMLATFGLGVLPLLTNLERAGLLVRSLRDSPQTNLSWIPIPRFSSVGPTSGGGDAVGKSTSEHSNTNHTTTTAASSTTTTNSIAPTSTSLHRAQLSGRVAPPNLLPSSSPSRLPADYSWQFSRAALRLVTEFDPEREVRPGTAAAVSAPYSGYTPLTARLAEAALSEDGWSALPQVAAHNLLLSYGHTTVEHVAHDMMMMDKGMSNNSNNSDGHARLRVREAPAVSPPGFNAIIVVVGGLIRAEASALRLAAKATGVKAIIATTAVTGPDDFVLSLSERI